MPKPSKKKKKLPPVPFTLPLTVDVAVAHVCHLWTLLDMKSKGFVTGQTVSDDGSILELDGAFHPAKQPPELECFEGFMAYSRSTMSVIDLAGWYIRYSQRWNCSSVCCLFTEGIVPELARRCVFDMEGPEGSKIKLSSLRVHTLFIAQPHRRHTIHFDFSYTAMNAVDETIEAAHDGASCSHNFLRCKDTGVAIDFSFCQFTGKREFPHFFHSVAALEAAVTGEGFRFLHTNECRSEEISEQLGRDADDAGRNRQPDKQIGRLSKLAATNMLGGWEGICRECFGSSSNLKRCSTCKCVLYCGKTCQKLHWKREHKHSCCAPNPLG